MVGFLFIVNATLLLPFITSIAFQCTQFAVHLRYTESLPLNDLESLQKQALTVKH
jgi:uncharacterized protein YqhQ